MNNEDINEYVPSILNPRTIKKRGGDLTLTQNSIASRCSLSLKRTSSNIPKILHQTFPPGKENSQNKKTTKGTEKLAQNKYAGSFSLTQDTNNVLTARKENSQDLLNFPSHEKKNKPNPCDETSVGFSAIEDINTVRGDEDLSPIGFCELLPAKDSIEIKDYNHNECLRELSSATELEDNTINSTISTNVYENSERPTIAVNFGVLNCDVVDLSTKNSHIKNIVITRKDKDIEVDCEVTEDSNMIESPEIVELSSDDEDAPSPPKKSTVAVNLEIKRKTESLTENSKVLILNTDAVEKLSHVIVQPPNYKLVKRKILDRRKFKNNDSSKLGNVRHGTVVRSDSWIQERLDSWLVKRVELDGVGSAVVLDTGEDVRGVAARGDDMNRGAAGVDRCERSGHTSHKSSRREVPASPKPHSTVSPRSAAKVGAERPKREVPRTPSPRKNADSIHFNLPSGKSSNKNSQATRVDKTIPYHKFVAGTHFAVDAFSYGELPNVRFYFLTHFHSDHYSGLKKSFKKTLFCSQITAELCITRLGVNQKCIQVMNFDEPMTIDGIEVIAVDANHCPGAMMLVFTLPNGKTLLHTGDFRASPAMESYPVFWNKDVHTIYLDSTYCNPRYDFPTQDQCLEMALYILRQKKMSLEKAGKKFSSVLIVCGTYTIGKEKFFMGVARRVGCSVWACPEKDKVLQAVEGRSFSSQPPSACQLHVVPMRDLTHEKLRAYLDSLQGVFNEVVAFKPSGWENGKNSSVEKEQVTIHGIPYSEHSSFSEMIRFVKFLQPQQVCPTVDISGGIKAVQKYFPCPLVGKEAPQHSQSKVTDYFSIQNRQHVPAVT